MSPHGSIQHPSPHNSGHSYTSNAPPNLHLDLHHHSTDMMGGHLQIGTPMMSHHQENVFDSLHESQK